MWRPTGPPSLLRDQEPAPCQRRHLSHPSGKRREGFQRTLPQKERKNISHQKTKEQEELSGAFSGKLQAWNEIQLFHFGGGGAGKRAKNRITKTNFIWNIQWKKYWIRTNVNNKKKWGILNQNEGLMTLLLLKNELNPFSNFLSSKRN